MRIILLALLVAALTPFALSQDNYLSPSIGQLYPVDWLEGGYTGPIDRSAMMDPGIAGMVRWLDSPLPSYPWYSSGGSFYRQMAQSSTFAPYTEYYTSASTPVSGDIVSQPVQFDITQGAPFNLFYGNGQGLSFSQYLSITSPQTNDLWIRGQANWTQYLVSPVGMTLELIADVPGGGMAGLYETISNETTSQNSRTYQFYPGYNSMRYRADEVGRHMLYFVVNNQPSNVVVIDVFAQAPLAQSSIQQAGQYQPAATPAASATPAATATPASPVSSPSLLPAAAATPAGNTSASIVYPSSIPFQVYIDGVYAGMGENGRFNFSVTGGRYHVISIWDGFWMYENSIFFQSGVPKEIYVEAV